MANNNPNYEWRSAPGEREAIDREMDAALEKYSAVEPRAGLEERIFANLRAERENIRDSYPQWTWSRRAFAAVSALAVVIIVIFMSWRLNLSQPSTATKHSPGLAPAGNEPAKQAINHATGNPEGGSGKPEGSQTAASVRPVMQHRVRVRSVREEPAQIQALAAASPKLDRFPSRQPMSEQEAALIHYVREFPAEAVLIARGQDEYEKELEKRRELERAENEASDSNLQER